MSEQELKESFDEMLDETNPEIVIGSLRYSPSQVLEAVDPIAYRIGLSEWESFQEEE